ncbi:MAG TPA: sigma-70 family RNA polymerase sigma factor [Acidimicrobiales bacterium]|nr:sigma-70 family RNA polymerase sigma factor [Acidimicrobiales bacterium]
MRSTRRSGEEGLEVLFRREFAPMVRALTILAGDAEAAADAVQDAFVQAHRHWARVSRLDNPTAWVRHAAINRLRNQRRGHNRMIAALPRLLRQESVEELTATLDLPSVLALLPEQQRAVVTLYYLLEQPTSAVADTLGVSEATVRSHLRHARVRLAGSLGDAGPVATAGEVAT